MIKIKWLKKLRGVAAFEIVKICINVNTKMSQRYFSFISKLLCFIRYHYRLYLFYNKPDTL